MNIIIFLIKLIKLIKSNYDYIFYNSGLLGSIIAKECAKNSISSLILEKNKEFGLSRKCGNYLEKSFFNKLDIKNKFKTIQAEIKEIISYNGNNEEISNQKRDFFTINSRLLERLYAMETVSNFVDVKTFSRIITVEETDGIIEGIILKFMRERSYVKSKLLVSKSTIGNQKISNYQSRKHKTIKTVQYEIYAPNYSHTNKLLIYELNKLSGKVIIFPSNRNNFYVWLINLENKIDLREFLNKYLNISEFTALNIYNQNFIGEVMEIENPYKNHLLIGSIQSFINPLNHHSLINEIRMGFFIGNYLKERPDIDDNFINKLIKYNNDFHLIKL